MSLDTPPSCKSPQMPLSSLVIPPLDLVTILHLTELLKDVLKAVKKVSNACNGINTPPGSLSQTYLHYRQLAQYLIVKMLIAILKIV